MRLTADKFCSSLTVWQRSTTVLGNTYSRVLPDWVQETWQCSALGSTWHAIIYFSWLLLNKMWYQDFAWSQCVEPYHGAGYIAMQRLQTHWYYLDRWKQNAFWGKPNSNYTRGYSHIQTKVVTYATETQWGGNTLMQTFASSQIWIHIYIHTVYIYIYKFRYASHTFAHSKTTSLKTCKTENTAKHECTQNPIIFFSRGETIRVRSIVPSKFRSPIGNTGRKRPQHILHSVIQIGRASCRERV